MARRFNTRFSTLGMVLLATVAGWLGLAGGCAEVKYALHYAPGAGESTKVWPAPPESARFQYAGQLTGFENFQVAEGTPGPGAAEVALMLVVGVDPATGFRSGEIPGVLQRPQTGMVDGMGRIYVTDASRAAVYVFDQLEGKLHIWNKAGPGGKTFAAPVGIVQGPGETIYVADAELGKVVVLDQKSGKPISQLGSGVLKRPTGLARDPASGDLFVADTVADDLKVFNDRGDLVTVIGRSGEGKGEFNAPTHVAFQNGWLYVTDTFNTRVQVVDRQGKWQQGIGSRGVTVGNLVRPKGVAVDGRRGLVYVVESFFDHLLVFDRQGEFLLPIGGTGKEIGSFYLPSGVWTDGGDRVFVADMFNGRVVIFRYVGDGASPSGVPEGKKKGGA